MSAAENWQPVARVVTCLHMHEGSSAGQAQPACLNAWPGCAHGVHVARGRACPNNNQHKLRGDKHADPLQHMHITSSTTPAALQYNGRATYTLGGLAPLHSIALIDVVGVRTVHCCVNTHVLALSLKTRA